MTNGGVATKEKEQKVNLNQTTTQHLDALMKQQGLTKPGQSYWAARYALEAAKAYAKADNDRIDPLTQQQKNQLKAVGVNPEFVASVGRGLYKDGMVGQTTAFGATTLPPTIGTTFQPNNPITGDPMKTATGQPAQKLVKTELEETVKRSAGNNSPKLKA